jgi:VWFA-related protein
VARHPERQRLRVPVSVCALALAGLLSAQESEPPSAAPRVILPPVSTEVVYVDVVVTDKSGRPATDLTKSDFQVFEDGRPVEIVNFSMADTYALAPEPGDPTVEIPDVAPMPANRVVPEDRRVHLAVFVDNFNLHPGNRKRVFDRLREFMVRLPAGYRVTIASYDGAAVRTRLAFTEDLSEARAKLRGIEKDHARGLELESQRQRLAREFEVAETTPPQGDPINQARSIGVYETANILSMARIYAEREAQDTRSTLAAMRRYVGLLGGLPGRKALVYVGDGLPTRPGEAMYQALMNKVGERAMRDERGGGTVFEEDVRHEIRGKFKDLVDLANANRVTFYCVDASTAQPSFNVTPQEAGSGLRGDRRVWDSGADALFKLDRSSSLSWLADATGGIALEVDSQLGTRLKQLSEDLAVAYAIAYAPPNLGDGRTHKIAVKVARQGLKVRHRQGYRDKSAEERATDLAFSALLADTENPMQVALESGKARPDGKGGFRLPMIVKFPVDKVHLVLEGGAHVGKLIVFIVVQSEQGGLSEVQRREVPLRFEAGRVRLGERQVMGFPLPLALRPGEYVVAVALRDEMGGRRAAASLKVRL